MTWASLLTIQIDIGGIFKVNIRNEIKAQIVRAGMNMQEVVGDLCRHAADLAESVWGSDGTGKPSEPGAATDPGTGEENRALRKQLVELHEQYPALGLDSLYHMLQPEFGCSRKRVHRQMRLSGISSVSNAS